MRKFHGIKVGDIFNTMGDRRRWFKAVRIDTGFFGKKCMFLEEVEPTPCKDVTAAGNDIGMFRGQVCMM